MAERTPPPRAQDKLAFLLSLVPYLMDRDRVTVTEAAAHFGVPPEQLREAVTLIAMSGVPGSTSTYQHGDLFDISWDDFEERDEIVLTHLVAIDDSPRFSAREAAALIAGLQYLSSLPENADRAAITSLMSKLSRGSSGVPAQVAVEARETDATLAVIRDAVARGVQVSFDYLNARGESESRRIDPLLVESVDADWYVRGWCHTREALRTFRVDRMSNPALTAEPIEHHAGDVPVPETLFEASADDLTVTIEVPRSALPLIGDYATDGDWVPADGDRVRSVVRVSHYHGLKRLVASMPGVAIVVGPPEARATVAAWAQAGAERYR